MRGRPKVVSPLVRRSSSTPPDELIRRKQSVAFFFLIFNDFNLTELPASLRRTLCSQILMSACDIVPLKKKITFFD